MLEAKLAFFDSKMNKLFINIRYIAYITVMF